jgi:hypothetical protein
VTPLIERFRTKYAVDGVNGCWEWTAHRDIGGYGMIYDNGRGRPTAAHRVSYELHVGPIPDGLVLDHLRRNRACVNPAHLEPVTQLENVWRGDGRNRSGLCPKCGSEYDALRIMKNGFLSRECSSCKRTYDRDRRCKAAS